MSLRQNKSSKVKNLIFILSILLIPLQVGAASLSPQQIARVQEVKKLLGAVEPRPVDAIVEELSRSRFPEGQLQILEAVAQTYRDMLIEFTDKSKDKKEWLYSMVRLNMAFFQFGGSSEQNDTGLNITIRRKLKKYLSPELLANPKLFYSLE